MERLRRLQNIWGWLPAFRAVAESEHLPTASKALGVSPSALSRTIRLLEEDLGLSLFDRVGRNLRLNLAGKELLAAVRASMRQIDDVVQIVVAPEPRGPLHLAASTAILHVLVQPAVAHLRQRYPQIVPWIYGPESSERINERLLAGDLDLALVESPQQHPQLEIARLLELEVGIYCGPGHPLYRRDRVEPGELMEHDFVGPTLNDIDRFPPEFQPRVGLRVYQMWLALTFCLSGTYLSVLPHRVVDSWPGPSLWRIPALPLPLPSITVYMLTRETLSESSSPAIHAMIQVIRDLGAPPA